MSLVSRIRGHRGASGFGYASTAEDVTASLDLRGQTILITGANSGLGAESARVLHARGARILGAARSQSKADEACRALGADAVALACDLSEPESCGMRSRLSKPDLELDVILCNAGIMALTERELPPRPRATVLTKPYRAFSSSRSARAADGSRARRDGSSAAHEMRLTRGIQFDDLTFERNYKPWEAYGQSKLANLMFARASRGAGAAQNAGERLHPGVIDTQLNRPMSRSMRFAANLLSPRFFKKVGQGAATQCFWRRQPRCASWSGRLRELQTSPKNVALRPRSGAGRAPVGEE